VGISMGSKTIGFMALSQFLDICFAV